MPKPRPAEESFADLTFPVRGLSEVGEFGQQPADTTADAVNVRGFEPGTGRLRGGSRCGLRRYIKPQIGGLSSLIQHLNFIVDPAYDALLASFETEVWDAKFNGTTPPEPGPGDPPIPDGTGILDPTGIDDGLGGNRLPPGDRYLPEGGSGVPPNRNVPPDGSTRGWRYIQSVQVHDPGAPSSIAKTFGSAVTRHNLIVVCITTSNEDELDMSVTDTFGNTYTLVESVHTDPHGAVALDKQCRMYWCRTENGGDCQVTVTFNETVNGAWMAILEYGGLEITTPFEGSAQAEGVRATETETESAGAVDTGGTDRLVIGFFSYSRLATMTPHEDYTVRQSISSGVIPSSSVVFDDLSSLGSSATPTVESAVSGEEGFTLHTFWVAIGAAFRWGL